MTRRDVQRVRGRTSAENRSVLTLLPSGKGRNDDTEIHEDTEDEQPRRHEDTEQENPNDLCVSVSLWLVDLCVLVLPLWSRGRQTSSWPTERPPQPLPARDIKFPPYELQTLPNGLQVVVVLHHEQPAVTMRLLIRGGHLGGSQRQAWTGTPDRVAARSGSTDQVRAGDERRRRLHRWGDGRGRGHRSDLRAHGRDEDSFDAGLRMLSEMARHPAFAPHEIERQRQQMLSGLRVSLEDPSTSPTRCSIAWCMFHPYGMPETGTPRLSPASPGTICSRSRALLHPNNAILAIVGDITAEKRLRRRRKCSRTDAARPAVPDVHRAAHATRRVIVINKPDRCRPKSGSAIWVFRGGTPTNGREPRDPDSGGEGSNRLHQILRTERGSPTAHSQHGQLKEAGDFVAKPIRDRKPPAKS